MSQAPGSVEDKAKCFQGWEQRSLPDTTPHGRSFSAEVSVVGVSVTGSMKREQQEGQPGVNEPELSTFISI